MVVDTESSSSSEFTSSSRSSTIGWRITFLGVAFFLDESSAIATDFFPVVDGVLLALTLGEDFPVATMGSRREVVVFPLGEAFLVESMGSRRVVTSVSFGVSSALATYFFPFVVRVVTAFALGEDFLGFDPTSGLFDTGAFAGDTFC